MMTNVLMTGLMALLVIGSCAAATIAQPKGLRVCTNTACRKGGSSDTLSLLQALASTAPVPSARAPKGITAAALQQAHACAKVEGCGCLGGCGSGPNVASVATGEIFHDIYKPVTAQALLEAELGLNVPDAATK